MNSQARSTDSVTVRVPAPLRSYTGGSSEVSVVATTLRDALAELDRRYAGIRFRIIDEQDGVRQHIKLFVNAELNENLDTRLSGGDEIHIICALSGG